MAGVSIFKRRSLEDRAITVAGVNLHLSIVFFQYCWKKQSKQCIGFIAWEVVLWTGSDRNAVLNLVLKKCSLRSQGFYSWCINNFEFVFHLFSVMLFLKYFYWLFRILSHIIVTSAVAMQLL